MMVYVYCRKRQQHDSGQETDCEVSVVAIIYSVLWNAFDYFLDLGIHKERW